ncbi:MAG TPA: hypothetical protein VE977_13820 [Pyrinomonadaceae bacterium]|nr:hypothetical protein [Pyrinomonadaceae bacterium]
MTKPELERFVELCSNVIDTIPEDEEISVMVDLAEELVPEGRTIEFYQGWMLGLTEIIKYVHTAPIRPTEEEEKLCVLAMTLSSAAARRAINEGMHERTCESEARMWRISRGYGE